MNMGYASALEYIKHEIQERRRNWILRVRYGPIDSTSHSKSSKTFYENDFLLEGKSMNATAKRRQVFPRDITFNKNHNVYPKSRRFCEMTATGIEQDFENLKLKDSKSLRSNKKGGIDALMKSCRMESQNIQSFSRRIAQQSSEYDVHRRWSDCGSVATERVIGSTKRRQRSRSAKLISSISDICIAQSFEDIEDHFSKYARRKVDFDETTSTKSSIMKLTSDRSPASSHRKGNPRRRHRKDSSAKLFPNPPKERESKQRQGNEKLNFMKQKRKVLMPSGDSSGSKSPSRERMLWATGRTESTPSFNVGRRGSRALGRSGFGSKSMGSFKVRRGSVLRPESPPTISKDEMQEIQDVPVIRKFLRMPKSRPKVVCFDYPGVDLTHMDVREAIERVIPDAFDAGKVVSIQFENLNVKLATGGLRNRWLIELKDFTTRNALIRNGLTIKSPDTNSLVDLTVKVPKRINEEDLLASDEEEDEEITFPPIKYPKKVEVKLNDVVAMEEYKLFLRRTAAEEKLQNAILLCTGRGDKLLSTML